MDDDRAIRVLVVDDHALVRRGIVSVLSAQPGIVVVGEASDGAEAAALYDRLLPDVTLMDLRMPQMDGTTTMAVIRKRHGAARFIVLTMYDGEEDIVAALQGGTNGYLLKGAHPEELVAAIRAVYSGRRSIASAVAQRMVESTLAPSLTIREEQILALLVRGRSNQEIADELSIAPRTAKNHLTSLFAKLGVTSRTQAAIVALQRGLIRLTDP